jgi:hypothetical protein
MTPGYWPPDVTESPLLARGWVYQEMTLSYWVLHFFSQQMIWECLSCRKHESGHADTKFKTDERYEKLLNWSNILTDSRVGLKQLWHSTVEE